VWRAGEGTGTGAPFLRLAGCVREATNPRRDWSAKLNFVAKLAEKRANQFRAFHVAMRARPVNETLRRFALVEYALQPSFDCVTRACICCLMQRIFTFGGRLQFLQGRPVAESFR
jgi:hypothetical protein